MYGGEMPIIDCDAHCAVPSTDALVPFLPDHWQETVVLMRAQPQQREPPAIQATYPSWSTLATNGAELTLQRLQEDVLAHASLTVLHCYYDVAGFTHPYLAPAMATAVNRWMSANWLDRDDRLLASAVITPQFPEAAVQEIERIAEDPRFVQVLVPARSPAGYGDQRYWPIWQAAAEHGLAIGVSAGGPANTAPTPVNWLASFMEEYGAATLTYQSHVLSIAVSGMLTRFPELRIVMMESGWTWLPGMLWRMDENWREFQREVPWLHERPSSHVAEHFRFTTQPVDAPPSDPQLQEILEQLGGTGMLMFGSDYPHRYARDPSGLRDVLTSSEQEEVFWRNAYQCYHLEKRAVPARSILNRSPERPSP